MSDTRIWAEIILDRIHVHEALFGLLLQAKGPDRVILITDSVSSCPQKGVKKSGGAYRLRNGALAGSSLTMIKAVQNAVRCGLALTDAVALATSNPARVFGVYAGKGSLGMGKDADLVVFDKNFDVKTTVVHGRIVFRKKGF
jgi:N-acetylglucosamine-6-phosphate deacetylase